MIRTCDGTDRNLLHEQVARVAQSGQETMSWEPCACGLVFDDVERLVIYPHYFIPTAEEKAELQRRAAELAAGGKSAEEIREWLTSQRLIAMVESPTTTTEGSPMGEGNDFAGTTGEQGEDTAVVSAEGTDAASDAEAGDDNATEADAEAGEQPKQNTGY